MKNFFAHLISIILIPLLVPVYLFYILLFFFPGLTPIFSFHDKVGAVVGIFIATSLLPFVLVWVLFKKGLISSLTLDNKKDRVIPQLFSCFNYFIISVLLFYYSGNNGLTLSMIASTLSLIVLTIITPYWKISAHASGALGIFSIATVLYLKYPNDLFTIPYSIILFMTIAVCMARLHLKVHTPMQILAGCFLGGTIGSLLFYFFI